MEEHDKAVEAELHRASGATGNLKAAPLFTIEIESTQKTGVYSIRAYGEDGAQIAQCLTQARAASIIQAVSRVLIDAGMTATLPMIGAEQLTHASEDSHHIPDAKSGDDFSFTDILEGVAGALRKAGAGVKR